MKLKKSEKVRVFLLVILIVALTVIGSLVAIEQSDLNMYGYKVWHLRFFNHFFVDNDNKFNWIGITSVLAVISLTFTAWDSRRKMKIDLISKSRITWMEQVRPLVANFYTSFSKYLYTYYLFAVEHNGSADMNAVLTEEMNELKRNYYQIMLFVPKNQTNELLLKNLKLLWDELDYIVPYYDRGQKEGLIMKDKPSFYLTVVNNYLAEELNKAIDDSSQYFKDEWEKAKRGE